MCGIAGLFKSTELSKEYIHNISNKMINSLAHRGPDSNSYWYDTKIGLTFCHTRLSIIDLTDLGSQPMISNSKNFVIIYNGEIYNAKEIKNELKNNNVNFKSNSDTEVLLEACEKWGIKKSVNKCIGMFAFALWDKSNKKLSLVRDRLGIKPLYYGVQKNNFFFASELKALKKIDNIDFSINKGSLRNFLQYSYIRNPESIYENIFKLQPGTILTIDLNKKISLEKYWSLDYFLNNSIANQMNEKELTDYINNLIIDSVKKRMISDVPFGCFLSGGIDSSLVTALMQNCSLKKIQTFTIGFDENIFDEAKYAKKIASYLGTEHNEHYFTDKEAYKLVPNISRIYDEPFADSSQIPTILLSEFTSKNVKVALSGDGGDELFRGYNRYNWTNNFNNINKFLPQNVRIAITNILKILPNQLVDSNILNTYIPNLRNKMYKINDVLKLNSKREIYNYLIKNNTDIGKYINFKSPEQDIYKYSKDFEFENFNQEMQFLDTLTYLPEDILTKVDRASMSVGLEVRVPLLDHRIVEIMISNDIAKKNFMKNKYLLKKILSKYIPEKLFKRPKMGFGVPLGKWLRGPLKEWSCDMLSRENFKNDDFLNYDNIYKLMENHQNNKIDNSYKLWPIIIYKSWLIENSV